MQKLFILIILIYSQLTLYALTDINQNGKSLYQEANCQKCHGNDIEYDGKAHKVKNKQELSKWVNGCAIRFNSGWFPEEEKAVVDYLNEVYYDFK